MPPLDKQAHGLAGYCIGLTFGLITPVLGLFLACLAGWGKEEYDKRHGGTYDKYDILATVAGGVIGSAVALFYLYFGV